MTIITHEPSPERATALAFRRDRASLTSLLTSVAQSTEGYLSAHVTLTLSSIPQDSQRLGDCGIGLWDKPPRAPTGDPVPSPMPEGPMRIINVTTRNSQYIRQHGRDICHNAQIPYITAMNITQDLGQETWLLALSPSLLPAYVPA
jgi:hypothetical protein